MNDSKGILIKDGDTIITSRGVELSVVVDSDIYYAYAIGNEESIIMSELTVDFTKKQ